MEEWLTIPFSQLADRLTRSLNELQREQGSEASSSWQQEIVEEIVKDLEGVKKLRSGIQDSATEADKQKTPTMQVKRWLVNLKALSFDAEEILEEYEYELHQVQLNAEGFDSEVRALTTSTSLSRKFLEEIKSRVRSIKERLDEMHNMRRDLGLVGRGMKRKIEEPPVQPDTGFLPNPHDIHGRDQDKSRLITMLTTGPKDGKCPASVDVLIGAGGVGKTTLAQHVYKDQDVVYFFGIRAWVCVSEVFNVNKITRDVVKVVTGKETSESTPLSTLQEDLRKAFSGKTFLLVLDDVWNEDPILWRQLDFLLGLGDTRTHRSKVLVTTRSDQVAMAVQPMTTQHYHLKRLTDELSLQLLRELAFERVDPADKRREDIAERIADKCRGSPLAITVIGKLLRNEDSVSEWEKIRDSELWEMAGDKHIMKTLELSYAYLPMHLKQCFLYCSAFPKDHVFAEEELIRRWMAQSMIRGEFLEDEGAKCFKGLLQRSFLIKTASWPIKGRFVLHDLMHDLAQYILKEELSLLYDESETTKLADRFKLGRQLTIDEFDELNEQQLDHARHLFLGYADYDDEVVVFSSRKILRMKHLRYLESEIFFDQVLLNSLGRLCNLQTLDISLDSGYMPKGMCMLKNLRRLKIYAYDFDYSEYHFPKGFGRLTNLRTLALFNVRREGEYCTIADLKDLRYIRGHIWILGLGNVIKADEAKEAQLDNKPDIRHLDLSWGPNKGGREADEVLENLQPHVSLEMLSISDFEGRKLPSWLGSGRFTNLISVNIQFCNNCKSLPGLGQLPCLQYVWIQGFPCMERVGPEFYGHVEAFSYKHVEAFSELRRLSFVNMHNLEEFCEYDACKFPRLETLDLIVCPILQVPPIIQRRPTALRTLNVRGSTNVIRWCETEEGKTALVGVSLKWWKRIAELRLSRISAGPARGLVAQTSSERDEILQVVLLISWGVAWLLIFESCMKALCIYSRA